jgi:hypothetical protein
MRHLVLVFASLLTACGLILDTSPPDPQPLGLGDGSVEPQCDTAADCEEDPCFGAPTCVEGVCVLGEAMDCSALDQTECIKGVCVSGECVVKASDSFCDDGIECTLGICGEGGKCFYEARHDLCDDGIGCTLDYCAPGDGGGGSGCVHTTDDSVCAGRIPNEEGVCMASVCSETAATDDGSGCVTVVQADACGADMYCSTETGKCTWFVEVCQGDDQCSDGNACNGHEICVDGVCFAGEAACPTSTDPCLEPICIFEGGEAFCDYRTIDECLVIDPVEPALTEP